MLHVIVGIRRGILGSKGWWFFFFPPFLHRSFRLLVFADGLQKSHRQHKSLSSYTGDSRDRQWKEQSAQVRAKVEPIRKQTKFCQTKKKKERRELVSNVRRMEIIFSVWWLRRDSPNRRESKSNTTLNIYLYLTQREEEEVGIRGKTDTVKKEKNEMLLHSPSPQKSSPAVCLQRRI
jgi:hypothetical protein